MSAPSPADVAAAKEASRKRFGHDRLVGVDFHDPVTGELLVTPLIADLTLASAGEYYDQRADSVARARATLLADRLLWPGSVELERIRSEWGAFDTVVETRFRAEVGFAAGDATPRPLTAATAPPGLSPQQVAELLAESEGIRLWSIYRRENGLACVMRQPQSEVWSLGMTAIMEATRAKRGQLCPCLNIITDHCVWAPGGSLRAHIEERPGRAEDLTSPWADMGGAAAKTSARRF